MDFRRETSSLDAPREIVVVSRHLPPNLRFWRENIIAPSPIIAGLEASLDLHTLRHCCCAERSFIYLAMQTHDTPSDSLTLIKTQ